MRVLIHPGFHKTGTTSLQRGATAQSAVLRGRLRVILPHDMEQVNHTARRYSLGPTPRRMAAFEAVVGALMARLDPQDSRPLLISSEHLCGLIPGRKSVCSYAAAPELVTRFAQILARRAPQADLTVWFTTRRAEAWLRSVYWQNLRGSRITESLADYADRLAPAARLADVVAEARDRLAGLAPVVDDALEDFGTHPFGPLGVALDRLNVSTEGLSPLPRQNVQPTKGVELLLSLNRSGLDDAALAVEKSQALRGFLRSGQTRRHRGASLVLSSAPT